MNRFSGRGIVATISLLFVGIANAFFGGFGVVVTLPNPDDPRQKDAALLVQPMGCHGPGSSLIVKAEGLVNGKRQTIALQPVVLEPGAENKAALYMLKHVARMKMGSWVLAITARKEYVEAGKTISMDTHALVKVAADGKIQLIDRPREQSWNEAKTLPDGKTKMLLYPFGGKAKVAATYIVWGDLHAAVEHTLKGS